MLKRILATISFLWLFTTTLFAANDTLKIPFERELGTLQQRLSSSSVSFNFKDTTDPWHKTFTPVKGIPEDWGDKYYVGHVILDIEQFTYQHYLLGNITERRFIDLQNDWNWKPDTTVLSTQPIQCYLSVILKVLTDSSIIYKVDANGDLDFSDEQEFAQTGYVNYSDTASFLTFEYETRRNGKVIRLTSPIKFGFKEGAMLYHIPQKGKAKFDAGGISETLWMVNGMDVFFKHASIVKQSALNSKKVWQLYIEPMQYINFGDVVYQYINVANNGDTLVFVKQNKPKDAFYSPQYGFKAPLFEDKEMTTQKKIKLEDYRGKYVLLDIWATWCTGCIQDLPYFKAAYDSLDHDKIEFISIAGDSNEADIRKLLDKHKITWPQIKMERGNPIIEKYNITGYPVTLLIDPNGVIVSTRVYGQGALKIIREEMGE